jgi:hypothetical protein
VHALDFVATFAILKKTPPWSLQLAMFFTQTQMMDIKIIFPKWQRDIGIPCKNNSSLEHIVMTIGSTCNWQGY